MRPAFCYTSVLALILPASVALADRYSITPVFSTQKDNFAAVDDFGDYTINVSNDFLFTGKTCGGSLQFNSCYYTVYANGSTQYTTFLPTLLADASPIPGSGCGFSLTSFYFVNQVFCNNGHELVLAYASAAQGRPGLYSGPDPLADNIGPFGSFDGGTFTATGSLYFIDGANDTLDIARDLDTIPTPEPSSMALLGSGLLVIGAVVRRGLTPSAD